MFTTDERMIAGVKAMYPAGTKIVLDSMGDDPRPIPPGTKGTVSVSSRFRTRDTTSTIF